MRISIRHLRSPADSRCAVSGIRAQWLIYNLFMRKAEKIDSIASPTAEPTLLRCRLFCPSNANGVRPCLRRHANRDYI